MSDDDVLDIAAEPADLGALETAIDAPVRAMFAAGLVGNESEALFVWLDLSQASGANLAPLRHALALEGAFLDSVTNFASATPPRFPPHPPLDITPLSAAIHCDRPLCVLIQCSGGAIRAGRDYSGIDVVHLEELAGQIERITEHMGGELAWGLA